MTVHVFFNSELVEQLAGCGITARRASSNSQPRGFVLDGRRSRAPAVRAVTHVIDERGHVTITGQRRAPAGRPGAVDPVGTTTSPRAPLELAEDCARLRRDNQRLSDEVARLRAEVDRLTVGPRARQHHEVAELDDASRRFALLELE